MTKEDSIKPKKKNYKASKTKKIVNEGLQRTPGFAGNDEGLMLSGSPSREGEEVKVARNAVEPLDDDKSADTGRLINLT